VLAAGIGGDSFSVDEFCRAWGSRPSFHEEQQERLAAERRVALID